ncbi:hypothetical protein [Shewanella scandinavica]|uniref:hypothetical protein n=1 Tax=Shewanella scandinavica TaxID=3063538 RepID=UPI003192A480
MTVNEILKPDFIIPVLVAFIGFLIAVTTALIAKEQKVSEFRHTWINDLRNDIAEFSTLILAAITEKYSSQAESATDIFSEKNKDIQLKRLLLSNKITKASFVIKLRLNINGEHMGLINSIDGLIESIWIDGIFDAHETKLLDKMLTESHKVLKNEWERVKKGEFLYKSFITLGKILLGAALAAFLVLVLSSNFPQYCPIAG